LKETAVRERIPHEVAASILAASTAFIGGTALNLPPWAIFISWAGTHLAGGPSLAVAKRLWAAMPAGSFFAMVIVLIMQHIGDSLGSGRLAQDTVLAGAIFVVNSALMYSGRLKALSLIPAMFFGFASYFATFFGGFGFQAGDPWAAWVSVVAMNALGPVFAYLAGKLTFPVREEKDVESAVPPGPSVNDPAVLAGLSAAFERYEKALTSNDIAVLDELFWDRPHTVRLGAGEELFGYGEIAQFRRARPAAGLERVPGRTELTTFGEAFAVTSMTFTRDGVPGVGRQSQAWVRLPEGWRVVAAHVSSRK
jgi:hypothetical protein